MNGEELGPVQQAFVEHDAFQCGYCTPGQIMAVEGLLRANPDPDARRGPPRRVRQSLPLRRLRPHLHGGRGAPPSSSGRGEAMTMRQHYFAPGEQPETPAADAAPGRPGPKTRVVGQPLPRVDAYERVSRQPPSTPPTSTLPGMLHAAVLRWPHAHARVREVDVARAETMPGVHAVLHDGDRPAPTSRGTTTPRASPSRGSSTRTAATRARRSPRSPPRRPTRPGTRCARSRSTTRCCRRWSTPRTRSRRARPRSTTPATGPAGDSYARGDVAAGFAAADVVVELTFRPRPRSTPRSSCTAAWRAGTATSSPSGSRRQGVYAIQGQLARVARACRSPTSG